MRNDDTTSLDRTIANLVERLLERRTPSGHWEGRLASSALSTATATVALLLHQGASGRDHSACIRSGIDWLAANQNDDGGWGDTVCSFSNLSTTLLCWSAASACSGIGAHAQPAIGRAEDWLRVHAGDLSPERLRNAVLKRYGRDRTFSVPILAVLALTGKLGAGRSAWRLVPQLPFELAALPHACFRWLRLPVVSYALPALVAIGQARHHHAPARNPLIASMRSRLRSRTLRVARAMQPRSGGYLEAVPLSAFVTMSLIDSGAAGDRIVAQGIEFLIASRRADGSWPIDANLATWVTTLSINALPPEESLSAQDGQNVLHWLLDQQAAEEHPFTRTRPGGWAWTDLPGGVPDADDTAGALLALWKLAGPKYRAKDAATSGIEWLLGLQNRDGGIPTFCRGWGALPFDRSAPDLTAHALEAWSAWYTALPPDLQRRVFRASEKAVSYLARHQQPDGSWLPLWFGNQSAADEANRTYGTARVSVALRAPLAARDTALHVRRRAVAWLIAAQNPDGGWGGNAAVQPSLEETGIAVEAMAKAGETEAMSRGVRWLIETTDEGRHTPAAPIGLYFARLWYYEELYPLVFALRGLSSARALLTERTGRGSA